MASGASISSSNILNLISTALLANPIATYFFYISGLVITGIGIAMWVAGVPLWSYGNKKLKRRKKKKKSKKRAYYEIQPGETMYYVSLYGQTKNNEVYGMNYQYSF